ncbi:hypothetical protein C5167_022003 [Papaver somniferum]|uniref:Uncharacterized protein n=1 Tax=Papaver somniferum TaxID=3469 RepID=A0A4Y7JJP0_PAPSO|nr:hypothetical protein C5167_022003 [Papaver somniferum]
MKDTVVKICAILDHIEANDENEDVEMNDQEYVSSTRQARKQAAQNIEKSKKSKSRAIDDDNDDDEKEPKYSVKVSGFDGKDVEDEYSNEEEENSNDEEEDEDEEKEDGDLVCAH